MGEKNNIKSVLLSVRPKWVEKISNKEKTIEVRKTVPKEVPFKVYIYCTKDKLDWVFLYSVDNNRNGKAQSCHGKVIGEFVCDKIYPIKGEYDDGGSAERRHKSIESFLPSKAHNELLSATCLEVEELFDYLGNGKWGYGWHISGLKIYDKPILLNALVTINPPRSWRYI